MNRKLIGLAAAAILTAGLVAVASPASAASITTPVSASTTLSNRGDSGGDGTDWAHDNMTRTLTVTEVSHVGKSTRTVYTFTATLTDKGTFTTINGASTPNQNGADAGKKVNHTVTGTVTGYVTYHFTANRLQVKSAAPKTMSGTPTTGNGTTGNWYKNLFPAGTTFGGAGMDNNWIWTYVYNQTAKVGTSTVSLPEFWVDSAAHGGQDPADGNIDGNLTVG